MSSFKFTPVSVRSWSALLAFTTAAGVGPSRASQRESTVSLAVCRGGREPGGKGVPSTSPSASLGAVSHPGWLL